MERAIRRSCVSARRMVAEVRPKYPSDWPTVKAVTAKIGIGPTDTLRKWAHQADIPAAFSAVDYCCRCLAIDRLSYP